MDLLHLLKNTFDRKRISANPTLTLTLTLKPSNIPGLTKLHHFLSKLVYKLYR